MKPLSSHWADQAAFRVVAQKGDKDQYVVASGITPSGVVHIGNFREVITVDLVARALRKLGKNVRFIYSWDSFDTFRKIPKDLPKQDEMKQYLYHPIARIPDPRGEAPSYAEWGIQRFEAELGEMQISPEFLYQHKKYSNGDYVDQIRFALENKDKIVEVLNEFRSSPLAEDWLPTAIYCSQCDCDKMDYERYDGEWDYSYKCSSCGNEESIDMRKSKGLKLNWRTDWPMRWVVEGVDFEPGGKDHSSDGGSYDTCSRIIKAVWEKEPPIYQQYDFVKIKGGPGKISSSAGNATSLGEVLEIYSPQLIRFIFARQKPNSDFSIAFDEDVIKVHDEFDRLEEQAYAKPDQPNKKWEMNRRTYELSMVEEREIAEGEKAPYRPGFRILCNRLQICGGDIERTLEKFYQEVSDQDDKRRFYERARCAKKWLEKFAPEDFRYSLNEQKPSLELTDVQTQGLEALRELVNSRDLESIETKELNQLIYDEAIRKVGIDSKEFFKTVYNCLINRDQGPRLPGFLKEIGKERLNQLL